MYGFFLLNLLTLQTFNKNHSNRTDTSTQKDSQNPQKLSPLRILLVTFFGMKKKHDPSTKVVGDLQRGINRVAPKTACVGPNVDPTLCQTLMGQTQRTSELLSRGGRKQPNQKTPPKGRTTRTNRLSFLRK